MVRAKFMLSEVRESTYGYRTSEGYQVQPSHKTLVFTAQYDDTIEEDRRFAKATPSGHFEMAVDNPAALAFFKPGHQYYFDVSEA